MRIGPEEREAYLHFIELNSSLWRIEDGVLGEASADRAVIIDLLSHDLHQAIRALYVGKILQQSLQCKLVGLVGNLLFSRDLFFDYDKAEAIRLARSYGVTEFIDLEDAGPSNPSDTASFFTPADTAAVIESLRACADADLPNLVLGWRTPTDCRIGEYVYETVPRITRNPFLTDVRAKLEELTREAHRIHNIIVERCRTTRIEAFTAGHISYTQWGMVADLVLRHGGKVVWFDCTGNFSAYLLTRPPGGNETLSSMVRQIDRALFERAFQERDQLSERFVSKVQGLFSSDYFLRPFWWEPTKPPPKPLAPLLRKIALSKLGWPDAQYPVVCVFIHCLSDLPRDDEQIYLDYYVWFVETLKIAVRDTSRKWIFKTHPANRGGYDVTNATERLKAEFQDHKHIVFLDDELEKVEVFAVCDLAVTIRGSIAYEMSVFGKPTLLAGRSVYSDLGFCHVANSADEYAALLTSEIESLALTSEMRERANFYLIYDKIACRIESTFMPYWTYRLTGDNNIWNALCERILYNISDLDPVAPALKAMLEGGEARTINPRYRELLAVADSAEALTPKNTKTEMCAPGEVLAFAREKNGLRHLLSKPAKTDGQGSWFSADQEAFIGFVLRADTDLTRGERLGLQVHLSGAPVECMLNISANGRAVQCVPLQGGGTRAELVDLGIDSTGQDNAIVIRLWLSAVEGGKIEFRLDSFKIDTLNRPRPPKQGVFGLVNRLFERFGLQGIRDLNELRTLAPRVSVVIKSYNHAAFVAQAIGSVLEQSFQDFEIVVTDDGSTDGTADVIRTFADPRIHLHVFEQNRGISNSMNATIARARGELIAILNSDDFALPGRLERQVSFLDSHPDIAAVFGMPHTVDESGAQTTNCFDFRRALGLPDFSRKSWLRQFFFAGNVLCAPTAMVRRSAYDRLDGYDPRLTNLQDLDMWIRLSSDYSIHVMSEELTAFRIRKDHQNMSAPRTDTSLRGQFEYAQILKRYRAMNPDVLLEAFAEDLAKSGIQTDRLPDIWLAELALTIPSPAHRLFALETLFATAQSDADVRRFREISGRIDVFGMLAVNERDARIADLNAERSRLARETRMRDESLQRLLHSRSWRCTAPLRWLVGLMQNY